MNNFKDKIEELIEEETQFYVAVDSQNEIEYKLLLTEIYIRGLTPEIILNPKDK